MISLYIPNVLVQSPEAYPYRTGPSPHHLRTLPHQKSPRPPGRREAWTPEGRFSKMEDPKGSLKRGKLSFTGENMKKNNMINHWMVG